MIFGLAPAGAYSDLLRRPVIGFTEAQASDMAKVVIERGAFPTCPHCKTPVARVEVSFCREDVFGLFPKDRVDNGHRKVTVHCHGASVTASAWVKVQKRKKAPAKSVKT